MPPFWKVKRELRRISQSSIAALTGAGAGAVSVTYYDVFLSGRSRRTEGHGMVSDKAAIYLIFPENGVQASHVEALRHLAQNGYESIVVSNRPLDDAGRAKLAGLSTLVIERPNYGYDFGGYREGVLALTERLSALNCLVLLNDSAWFPLPGSRNWLQAAESLNLDFVGAATSCAVPHVDVKRLDKIAWTFDPSQPKFHYTSFGLMLGKRMLTHPEFLTYWRRFPLTNDKRLTVQRGEIGLTKWVQAQRLSHGSTEDLSRLDLELDGLNDAELFRVFREIVVPGSRAIEAEWKTLIQRPFVSRDEAKAFILAAAANQGPAYALAGHLHRTRGFAFLKKSPLWLSSASSEVYHGLIGALSGDFGGVIRQEAMTLLARREMRQI